MAEYKNCHFANFGEIIDSGKDHHPWIPKPDGSLLVTRLSMCCQGLSPHIELQQEKHTFTLGKYVVTTLILHH